ALSMRLNGDGIEDMVVLRKGHAIPSVIMTQAANVFTIGNTADGGDGSLRGAIQAANSAGGTALIQFNIGGGAGPVIAPGDPLPAINVPITINGTTQGFVVLDGNDAGSSTDGFDLMAPNSLVNGIDMHNFHGFLDSNNNLHGGYGIALFGGHSTVENCFLGTDGNSFQSNASGLEIVSGANLIGGTASGAGNVISGNQFSGLFQGGSGSDGNGIIGNAIGTTADGQGALQNGNNGLNIIDSRNNTIVNNLISGNGNNGISLDGVTRDSGGNLIGGNFIGTDGTGSRAIGNTKAGVLRISSSSNNVGPTSPNARNIVSGNGSVGVSVGVGASNNLVQNNLIGTNVNGNAAVGNGFLGVFITGPQNTLGGEVPSSGNVITATFQVNGSSGDVGIEGGGGSAATGANKVQGNLIGTDLSGSFALGEAEFGLVIDQSPNNLVGGPDLGAGNLISGHTVYGLVIGDAGSVGNTVQGNFIGTDVTGTHAIPNQGFGVVVTLATGNTIINNLVSGNGFGGIGIGSLFLGGFGDSSTLVTLNVIGTDQSGRAGVPNNGSGIFVENDSSNNRIDTNLVAFNQGAGIRIPDDPSGPTIIRNPAIQIHLTNNLVHSNTGLGIDLGPSGPTPNPFNQQTGANLHQNFPAVSSAAFTKTSTGGLSPAATASITVNGTLQAKPSTAYSMEFYFDGNCDGGQGHQSIGFLPIFLGTGQVTTDGTGNGPYTFSFPLSGTSVSTSGFVNATATDPAGNTSELSLCAQVSGTVPSIPQITGASVSGKNLIVTGMNFDSRSVIEVNSVDQKTLHDSSNPNSLTGKKTAKKLAPGTMVTLEVRNSDGTTSAPFPFTR
ncbi:MAG: beta strand repeat-containing protein, partial [Blastocatellia bacterium]